MNSITNFSVRLVQRYLPSAFLLAVLLTFIVVIMGMLAGESPMAMAKYWGDGFSTLFNFGMQMVLVLITGYVLALSPVVQTLLTAFAKQATGPRQALVLTIVVSFICYYLNWGFGMVAGAILAREMGRRVAIHFPLIVAAAYGGELVRGPSSSIPLVIATPGHFMEESIGIIPVSQTLYSTWNIVLTLLLLVLLVVFFLFQKQPENIIRLADNDEDKLADASVDKKDMTPSDRLEHSRWPTCLLGLLAAAYLVGLFIDKKISVNLDTMILFFLALGLLLHKNSASYISAAGKAVTAGRGIIVQFPLYAGIAGMMTNSGLVAEFSQAIIAIATPESFPLLTFLCAGVVNFFIPSGGGQWAIQGPIMMEAAYALGADPAQTIMAFTWGDGWTNQIQPFWALPLLGVAGLSARDIMGYLLIWFAISGAAISGTFIVVSMLS